MAALEARPTVGGIRVRLHPFIHQVSGSTLMFKFDDDTICKPLLPKEYHFYKCLPEHLKQFTAQYKGSLEIHVEELDDGTCQFFGLVPKELITRLKLKLGNSFCKHGSTADFSSETNSENACGCLRIVDFLQQQNLKLKRSGSVEMDEDSLDHYDNPMTKLESGSRLNKRLAELLAGAEHRFILLENLVARFEFPSILDLKMGTRTYGDDDDDGKKARKMKRAEISTSKVYGFRLHGMQKFNGKTGKYETLDKYIGQKLSLDELKKTLYDFLHDGCRMREELLSPLAQKLQHYHDCVAQQDTFRFYSSSLLIIYDGSQHRINHGIRVKAIDFAHTTYQASPLAHDHSHVGPDKGYLLGIQNLTNIIKSFIDTEEDMSE